ncbi:hypothetical protein BT69DRAFT_354059 [Atractiella rhizophila]|nr:hypothetical protein BT69DRAFT_354059 [Atractiella rhizophila]
MSPNLQIILAEPVVFLPPFRVRPTLHQGGGTTVRMAPGSAGPSPPLGTGMGLGLRSRLGEGMSPAMGEALPEFSAQDPMGVGNGGGGASGSGSGGAGEVTIEDDMNIDGQPALLRGILKLNVTRATKIKRISVRLLGINDWDKDDPFEKPDETTIIDRTYDLFDASSRADEIEPIPQVVPTSVASTSTLTSSTASPSARPHLPNLRRTSSIGPGISHGPSSLRHNESMDLDDLPPSFAVANSNASRRRTATTAVTHSHPNGHAQANGLVEQGEETGSSTTLPPRPLPQHQEAAPAPSQGSQGGAQVERQTTAPSRPGALRRRSSLPNMQQSPVVAASTLPGRRVSRTHTPVLPSQQIHRAPQTPGSPHTPRPTPLAGSTSLSHRFDLCRF